MKTVEECVTEAMDGNNADIFPFLPYILQDFWELGSDPDAIIGLIKKHSPAGNHQKILDLGCGKGTVSINVAKKLGCKCLGIDAIPEFIDIANKKAKEFGVENLCSFEISDIRKYVQNLRGFDVIILGSIGAVFGDYYQTLNSLSACLNNNGFIIIDDGYIEDTSNFAHKNAHKKSEIIEQVTRANMTIITEHTHQNSFAEHKVYDEEFENLQKRCDELIKKHPEKANIFEGYVKNQTEEYKNLKSKIICSAFVIKKI